MSKALANPVTFAVTYIFCMLPTYYLQLSSTHASATQTLPNIAGGLWAVILLSMLALCWLCIMRGLLIGKYWLVALPVVAIAFELIPKLSAIPYVSVSYHILAVVIGVAFPVIATHQSALPNG